MARLEHALVQLGVVIVKRPAGVSHNKRVVEG